MHLRIEEEKKEKEKRMIDRDIKRLKKEGKVQSIAGFLICKEEPVDDWVKSKQDRFNRNRSSKGTRNGVVTQTTMPITCSNNESGVGPELLDSKDSDNEDVYLQDIPSFRPFRNALDQPLSRCKKRKYN